MEAYCIKCKAKREMRNAREVMLKGGRPALRGECVQCGTKLTRFLPKKK
ncbi:MAG: DUF5679 domain-containing protein [Anaerolineae bacterium]